MNDCKIVLAFHKEEKRVQDHDVKLKVFSKKENWEQVKVFEKDEEVVGFVIVLQKA